MDTYGYSDKDYADALESGHVPAPEPTTSPETGPDGPEDGDGTGGPEDDSDPIFNETVAAEHG